MDVETVRKALEFWSEWLKKRESSGIYERLFKQARRIRSDPEVDTGSLCFLVSQEEWIELHEVARTRCGFSLPITTMRICGIEVRRR